jgi:hypothetical protein
MGARRRKPEPFEAKPAAEVDLVDPQTAADAAAWLQQHRLPRDRTVELEDQFRYWLGEEGFEQIRVSYDPARGIWELKAKRGNNRECQSLADFRACVERITGVLNCHVEANRIVAMMMGDEVGAAFRMES